MSERLELSAEQAKALKEWWLRMEHLVSTREVANDEARRLHIALRPLFEPWRVERHPEGAPVLRRDGSNVVVTVNGLGFYGSMEEAEKIAAWLNAAERGGPS